MTTEYDYDPLSEEPVEQPLEEGHSDIVGDEDGFQVDPPKEEDLEEPEVDHGDAPEEEEVVEEGEALSDELYNRAIEAGLTDNVIQAFESVDQLESFLGPVEEPASLEPLEIEYPEELAPNWDAEFIDEEVIERIEAREAHSRDLIQQQQEMIQQLQAEQETRQLDSMFASAPEAFKELLGGDQTLAKLHSSSAKDLIEKRGAVVETLRALQARSPEASQEALFEKALRAEFPEAQSQFEQKKLSRSLKENKGRTLGRANREISQRTLTPEQRAIARIQDRLERSGGLI